MMTVPLVGWLIGRYLGVDPEQAAEIARSMGHAQGLSEFKVTSPLATGSAVLIHFHMWHRGSRRLHNAKRTGTWEQSKRGPAPFRPMVKFQFYSVSEPTRAHWDCGALGVRGAPADWGNLDGMHGRFGELGAPEVTAVRHIDLFFKLSSLLNPFHDGPKFAPGGDSHGSCVRRCGKMFWDGCAATA
jgi:hypothetical protein